MNGRGIEQYQIKAIFTPMMKFYALSLPKRAHGISHTHTSDEWKERIVKRFLNQIWCGLSVCRRVQNRAVVVYDCNLKSGGCCIEHIRTQFNWFISLYLIFFSFVWLFRPFFFQKAISSFLHGKLFRTFWICTEWTNEGTNKRTNKRIKC